MRFQFATLGVLSLVVLGGCGENPRTQPPAANVPTTPVKPKSSADDATNSLLAVQPAQAKLRRFSFHYKFRVKDLKPMGDAAQNLVRVWLPCAASTDCQEVTRLEATAPAELSEHNESRYGNSLLYLETAIPETGEFTVDVPYEVVRREVLQAATPPDPDAEKLNDMLRSQFLAADKMVPTTGKSVEMLKSVDLPEDPCHLARQLYDLVDAHVVYKKEGTGWGRGDTNWVCDSGYGNCTDFHSLFISLARSQGLPSRFEIGFSIPTDKTAGPIAGYHCWAWFFADMRGWVPVDISEADKHPELKEYYFGNLTADRVMFSLGRDLELVPQPASEPLNFFIYPHIEVGGQVLPKENVELQFSFADK